MPEYISGFIYGMSGVDHREQIAHCFHPAGDTTGKIADESHMAMVDISAGRYFKGVRFFGHLVDSFPQMFIKCHDDAVHDSVHLVTQWADQINQQHILAEKVGRHWLEHFEEVHE